jgi:hypothetical protein
MTSMPVMGYGLYEPTTTWGVTPISKTFPGDRACSGGTLVKDQFKSVTESPPGTYSATYIIDGISVTVEITTYADNSFDFEVTNGLMNELFVKGGALSAYLLYQYAPPVPDATNTGPVSYDTGVHDGFVSGTSYQDVSHLDFCLFPVYSLTIDKTAETSYTRTCDWTLDKDVDVDAWPLVVGDTGISEFTLTPAVTCTDNDWKVWGDISIDNPALVAATIESVTDVISDYGDVEVECGVTFPYTLAAGNTLECTYSAGPVDNSPDDNPFGDTNTATVVTSGPVLGGSDDADVNFGDPTTTVDGCVFLADEYVEFCEEYDCDEFGEFELCYGDAPFEFTYMVEYTCDEPGLDQYDNTATIEDAEDFELASDDASVNVVCGAAVGAEKDADTSYTRTWSWTIDKTGDQTTLTLSPGQTFLVNYQVEVDATFIDSDWAATGTITIENLLTDRVLTVNSVSDIISPDIAATVECEEDLPYDIPVGETLECSYSASLPDATQRLNTAYIGVEYATVTCDSEGCTPDGGTERTSNNPTADVTFGDPTTEVDECIDVTDDKYGDLGTVCAADAPKTFEYTLDVGPYDVCGNDEFTNCASFVTTDDDNDTGATGQDCWTVDVIVPCPGCTLTPGYWKTHSTYGPAAHPDDTWYLLSALGPDTPFFSSGQTYYQVLWTNPQGGNAYYILAHAYIAAELNQLNGASSTAEVDAAMSWAKTFFNTYTPTSTLSRSVRNNAIANAAILDNYNNGLIGPGHCSE